MKDPQTIILRFLSILVVLHITFLSLFSYLADQGALPGSFAELAVPREVDYLFIGDSHAAQVMPQVSEDRKVLNISTGGTNYAHHYYTLKHFLENGSQTRYLIMPLDPNSFASNKYSFFQRNQHFWVNILDYDELAELAASKSPIDFGLEKIHYKYFPYAFNTETWLLFLRSPFVDRTAEEVLEVADESIARDDYNDIVLRYYFYQTIALARSNDIEVVLISYPASSEYLATWDDLDSYYSDIFAEMQKAGHRLHWLDMRRSFKNDSDFRDGHHLFNEYKPLLTERILQRLKQIEESEAGK